MSVEAFVIAALVEEGTPRKAFQAGIDSKDFMIYEDEYLWIVDQAASQKPINWRKFQKVFPDFERVVPDERLQDLLEELKHEAGYSRFTTALDQAMDDLSPENYVERSLFLREVIGEITRVGTHASDILLSGDFQAHLKRIRELRIMREQGLTPGIPTGLKSVDEHWGGLIGGRTYLALGRPGDAKSFTLEKMYVSGFLDGRRMAMFSPELNEDEHRARIAALITAYPHVREEVGLSRAFRNRAILDGRDFSIKKYKHLLEWIAKQDGAMILFTQTYRRQKMTAGFIESRIDDLGIEGVIVDPIYKLRAGTLSRNASSWERLAQITDELCDLSEMANVPIVMSNQAHRQQGNRGDAPTKDNSFGSDAPVQEADCVFGVKHIKDEKKLVFRCTKNRFGEDFRVDLKFMPNIGILEDISERKNGYYNGHEDGSEDRVKDAVEEIEREAGYSPK